MKIFITSHAREEIGRRNISIAQIEAILKEPEQLVSGYSGKKVYQSRVLFENGQTYLIRIIVDENASPWKVITAYRTTKISKYWRET
ncbi:MAG: hypothetical protein COV67_01975 [Nitrospinae bacterium CG11_big_fil_rev_8_21_14_0_20_56_8]|nr:MAG: hypothetical protein COV67_01975 [Nitrospinae bacterium CG11_big_fil_rev_8_21_14_0_20_56_8]